MKAILRRPLQEFGMEMAWYGDRCVVVECDGIRLYEVPLGSSGPRTASLAMEKERQHMHEACQSFC